MKISLYLSLDKMTYPVLEYGSKIHPKMAKKRAKISSPYNHLKYHFTKSYLNISRFTKEDINRHMR